MKKILSVAAVLALVIALSVSAFAADAVPSVTYAEDDISVPDTVELDGETIEVEVSQAEMTTTEEETLTEKVEEVVAEEGAAKAVEVVDVELVNPATNEVVSADYFKENDTLTVVFVRDDTTTEVIAVLYWNDQTQGWDEADFDDEGNGRISVTFEHLCTVAFVTKAIESNTPTNNGGTTNNGGSTNKPGTQSPATGYNTTAWVVMTAVLLLAAGVCFVGARKKVTE